ncbi:MAG: TonB-dependent receptor [Chloracidobacterium sp.]|nr:TonB-dependent receptor [Chloracidobacterium sp.]
MKRFSIISLLILISSTMLFAQGTAGKLSGTVSGPDGLLPGATVVATDNSTGKEVTVTANESGFYQFSQLEFGTYKIKVTSPGFKTLIANEQKIDVGRDATFNATLQVGEITAEVVVTAGADIVTSGTAQVSNTVSPQQILSLPLITRSPLTLTTLQSGVQSNPFQGTSINGLRTSMTNITRDGINIQDTFIRSNATDFAPGRPSVDDTAEFTITTTNQEADQGYGGAQIRLVTPRGTKDFHGALFAYNRNSYFAANGFFNNRSTTPSIAAKPPFRNRNQYGGKVSGPMWFPHFGEGTPLWFKDKVVFFFSYEGIKDPVTAASTRTILTPAARGGAFTYQRTNNTTVTPFCPSQTIGSTCVIPDILGYARANLVGGASIPATLDPIVNARIISLLPTTSNFTGGDGFNTAGFRLLRASNQTRDQYASRVDADINDNNSIFFIYNYNKEVNLRPDVDTEAFTTIPDVQQFSDNKQITMGYRRVFSSNFVNEFRGGLFKAIVPFDSTNPTPAYHLLPTLVSSPNNTFMDQGRFTKSYNYQSNGDWIYKNHNFKFGGQLQYFQVDAYNDAGITPTVSLGTNTNTPSFVAANFPGGISTTQVGTSNAMLALFGGIVSSSTQSFNVNDIAKGFEASRQVEPIRHANHALYFADRWQVNSQLTLSLGVRWELYPAMTLESGVGLEPAITDINNPLPSLLRQDGTYVPIGQNAGKKNAYYKTKYTDFAPNFGFAWTPQFSGGIGKFLFGKTSVVRGGYSHSFANDSIITSIRNAAIGNAGLARTASTVSNQNGRLSGAFSLPGTPTFITPPRTYLQNNTASFGPFFGTVFAIDPKIETSRVKNISFGVQREFFGNTAFELRYVGTSSNNLVRSIDYNQIDIRNNGFAADFNRALNNDRLCTAANVSVPGSCATGAGFNAGVAGSVALPVFNLLGANALLTNSTILGLIRGGTPADLALTYITNNLNNHPSVASPGLVPFIKFLQNPASGVVNLLTNGSYYKYHSFQAEVRRRFSQGLYFQANYTFSKNLTNSVGTSQTLVEPFLDNANPQLDVQRADFDQTQTFNFNGVYQLPFGRGKRFLNSGGFVDKTFGGWELSGTFQRSTGAPITFIDPRGTLNRAGRSGRQTANSSLTAQQIQDLLGVFELNGKIYWINPSVINTTTGRAAGGFGAATFAGQAFFNVNPGETGNLGRTLINGPSTLTVNAALLKNIRFGENIRLQFRAEAFNLLNNTNFFNNTQFADINSTTFGQITSAGAARQMQFAVRFEF